MKENFKIKVDTDKVLKILGGSVLVIALLFVSLMLVNEFFHRNYLEFQSPVLFQSPVMVKTREEEKVVVKQVEAQVEPTPTPDPWDYKPNDATITKSEIAQADNKYILWSVYRLESSRGMNDGCKRYDKFNGFGYAQHDTSWNCYDTFSQVVKLVDMWFNSKKAKGLTLDEAVCLYNTGIRQSECEYLSKFKSL